MADNKVQSSEASLGNAKAASGREPSLGNFLTEARKRRGLSTDDVIHQTRIPAHYVRMIESDDYGLIADQLYLLPFLRRYAAFVGLDQEEVATRFVREVQRADSFAARIAEPIPVAETHKRTWIAAAAAGVLVVAIICLAVFGRHRHPAPAASPSARAAASPKPSVASMASAPAPAQNPGHPDAATAQEDNGQD